MFGRRQVKENKVTNVTKYTVRYTETGRGIMVAFVTGQVCTFPLEYGTHGDPIFTGHDADCTYREHACCTTRIAHGHAQSHRYRCI